MKKQKFSEAQILKALKEYEEGKNVMDIFRELVIHKECNKKVDIE